MDLVVNPPKAGEASHQLWQEEVRDNLRIRSLVGLGCYGRIRLWLDSGIMVGSSLWLDSGVMIGSGL